MIEGVEILSATAITTWYDWVLVVTIAAPIVIGLIAGICDQDVMTGVLMAFSVCMICLFIFRILEVGKYETGEYEYKVTIDDSVSMNDFLDKYEILDQEGKIFTVKERE